MTTSDPRQEFIEALTASVREGNFVRMTLGKPRGADPTLRNLYVRPIELRDLPHLTFLWRYERQDITKNHLREEALSELGALIGGDFHSAHLFTTARTFQLEFNKKGKPRLTTGPAVGSSPDLDHDRSKVRLLPAESQTWLRALGVTTDNGTIRTGMAAKHRQIHRFVEILSHLLADAPLPTDRPVEVADMGCGKGYLTFAAFDYFNAVANRSTRVHGIETREELVRLANRIADETGRDGLDFERGTIESVKLASIDVLIALHACDTATDDALARGIASRAALIVVAPCCQKELRPQLRAAPVLAPALRHGIFQERHAEFVTDALRALLLEWAGYETKVFEFISTEHTAKNTMITAIRSDRPVGDEVCASRVRELAAFYGIRTQALARHLGFGL
ncbi:MAG: SAM-dependent methyltransferase [Opitutaceae bacterium]